MRRALSLLLTLSACAAPASQAPRPAAPRWLATWTASPYDAGPRPPRDSVDRVPKLFDQTLRLVVRTSIGGERVRIRLSNEYGDRPLVIDAAHIAVRDSGTAIVPATDRALTFGGRPAVRMLPGAVVLSDPVALSVPALGDLAVNLHLADSSRLSTRHPLALQTSYVGHGNVASAPRFTPDTTLEIWPYLVGVDVINPSVAGVIVTLGNSITDGARSTPDANMRWPNILAARMLRDPEPRAVNAFIRTSGEFDGVIDFDAATRDPAHPLQFLPAYDSGDHLHPGDAGYRAMGEAVDVGLFRKRLRE